MKKSSLYNLIFIGAVLVAALVLYLLFGRSGPPGGVAVLQYGEPQQTMHIPLDEDKRYDIKSNGYTIHLIVTDGGIRFVDSPCPDHTCESFGVLRSSGDWAACLPALASLTVE